MTLADLQRADHAALKRLAQYLKVDGVETVSKKHLADRIALKMGIYDYRGGGWY